MQRLGIDHIDVVFVHDISSDNVLLPRPWPEEFAVALKGAFPALSQMRDDGVIKAWGIGVNTPEPTSSCDAGVRSRRVPARIAIFVDRPR